MKKSCFLAILAFAAIAAITLATSCSNSHSEKVDPIYGTTPVTNAFYTDANGNENFPLDQYHKLGLEGDTSAQRALVNQYRKVLTANVIRQYPEITDENNIHFILGSGFAKDVKSGDGKTHSGRFQNELIIILNDPSIHDTLFLACGNGMLSPLEFSDRHDFGHAERWRFTIQKGEGLANHLPELQQWASVANDLQIPIMNAKGEIVPISVYQKYLGEYTAYLFEGDVIDVLAGKVYNKAGQEADFDRRLAEAEKSKAEQQKANKTKKPQKGKQGKRR